MRLLALTAILYRVHCEPLQPVVQVVARGCGRHPPVWPGGGARLARYNASHVTYRCRDGASFRSGAREVSLACLGEDWLVELPPCSAPPPANTRLDKVISSQVTKQYSSSGITGRQGGAGLWLQDIVLPVTITIFTVVISFAACILLLFIKRHLDTPVQGPRHPQLQDQASHLSISKPEGWQTH